MIAASLQQTLSKRAEHIVRSGLLDCKGDAQAIYFLRELRKQATLHLDAHLDGVK